jgi:hypothetical protein
MSCRLFAVAAVCLASSGCGPSDPLETKVIADDPVAFSMWESKSHDLLPPAQIQEFDDAVQEYKFHIMAEGKATGSEAVSDSMREAINGRTIRYVLQQGLGWKLSRLEAERAGLEGVMAQNAQMRTRPGDTASADYLNVFRKRQEAQLASVTEEIALTREKLKSASPLPSR